MVTLLLDKGADLESQDKKDWTPLRWAAREGHEAVVKLLLERGAVRIDSGSCEARKQVGLPLLSHHQYHKTRKPWTKI